ncbi:DUF6489 family protein [Methylobacterium isbiliense]|nr:DUF6489 family protein [Methylobacterium isbiliense]MDN3626633.1 DUF6489 family protein [Methylobacterium isbiliense]
MQVTIDVDCTPEEARALLGLPDVQPLQVAVMVHMEKRLLAEADCLSPERLMKAWMSFFGQARPLDCSHTKRDGSKGFEPTS